MTRPDPRNSDLQVVAEIGAAAKSRSRCRPGVNGSSGQIRTVSGAPTEVDRKLIARRNNKPACSTNPRKRSGDGFGLLGKQMSDAEVGPQPKKRLGATDTQDYLLVAAAAGGPHRVSQEA